VGKIADNKQKKGGWNYRCHEVDNTVD